MMTEDDDAATLFHAAAHAVHADAEATVAKGEGMYALLTGVGVGAALLGARFLHRGERACADARSRADSGNYCRTAAITASVSNCTGFERHDRSRFHVPA